MQISETVQSFGLFLLERLASIKTVVPSTEICLKAIQLYLDEKDQYWIITHIEGESSDWKPYFIKRLQRESRSYELLTLLLDAKPYSSIRFYPLAYTLGELEIKNELKKIFFVKDRFAGPIARISTIEYPVNVEQLIKHLSSIKNSKGRQPTFNSTQYFRTSFVQV
jgi:hypothetical protein